MSKKVKKIILDVVPLTKIPLTRNQSFAYLFQEKLVSGALVSMPFSNKKIEGIVLDSKKDFIRMGNIELKKIEKVIEEKFLDENQIKLAKFISDYYISPLGVTLKKFVPKRVKSRNKTIQVKNIELINPIRPLESKKIILTKEQDNAVNEIIKKSKKYLLFGPAGSGKTEVYIHSILKLKEKNNQFQFLILVPEKTLTPQALERYGAYFKSEEIVLLSSNLSTGQYYSNWQKIKSGKAKIIIGTRMAVFAPFKNLGLIVIDEEQDMSYKNWDMNPRYDARIVAEKIAELHNCSFVRGSATPSVESYYGALNEKYKLLKIPPLKIFNVKYQMPETVIVDMKKERWNKNYTCISKKLKSEIKYALKYKQQIILFINRQGMSSFSICKNCKTVLKCPKCDQPLIYDEKGYYRCVHCSYKTSIIPYCKKCQGIEFKNVGLGTQKVEKEIKDLFFSAKVARIDSQIAKTSDYQEKIYRNFSDGKIDILIGTQMISKGWDLIRVALIGIIDTDNAFSIPDFMAGEKFYQNIVQISGRTGRPNANISGNVVIQTFQPENNLIKLVANRDWEGFFENEIKERKALNFPPFGKIIKLVFQDYSFVKAEAETERVYAIFKNISDLKIFEPTNAFLPKIRGRFRRQIIIKYKTKNISVRLKKELQKLGIGWIIDIDPVSIV